ncbi:MAG TPA: DUF3604 domain-containing protein [Kofleriaceae bacterium]|nr:DUF3604 domain-containing protein [Kofleriaceae bacterium]
MTVRSYRASILARGLALALAVPACTDAGAPPGTDLPPGADPPAATEPARDPAPARAPLAVTCPDRNTLKNPYFGDLHTHTAFSYDAYTFETRVTPMDAYAFARGMPIQIAGAHPGGPIARLDRPLDFAAITDHSELLAIDFGCGVSVDGTPYDPDSPFFNRLKCVAARSTDPAMEKINFAQSRSRQQSLCGDANPEESPICLPVVQDAWQAELAAAAAALDPCHFTSFIGYEWTNTCTGDGGSAATCHKNVIFGDTNAPAVPFDSLSNPTQESLWSALDTGCNGGPCKAITIPHNSNLSNGQAFNVPQGSEQHAIKYQKLVEIFQHKGASECFFDPANPTDPKCNFEYLGGVTEPNLPRSYVRTGLKMGLTDQANPALHKNPLQMGIVGATDDHNGAPGNTREDTWPGHVGVNDDTPALRIRTTAATAVGFNPGGVAVAWAEQNTRDAIFAAFQRRETYATSGPRITVRLYQTWDQTTNFCADPSFPSQIIAAGGLPMGSNIALPPNYTGGAPRIVVFAARDPLTRADVANLAEVDLVEAWIDPTTGAVNEHIAQRLAPAGGLATTCQIFRLNGQDGVNTFHAGSPSFYYARVLQLPTDRWSVRDCLAAPPDTNPECDPGGKLSIQVSERAWTSPVWYLP